MFSDNLNSGSKSTGLGGGLPPALHVDCMLAAWEFTGIQLLLFRSKKKKNSLQASLGTESPGASSEIIIF